MACRTDGDFFLLTLARSTKQMLPQPYQPPEIEDFPLVISKCYKKRIVCQAKDEHHIVED